VTALDERLKVLIEGGVVIPKAADIAKNAVKRLKDIYGFLPEDRVSVFVTHLATALTRLERKETVGAPPPELLKEVEATPFIKEALLEIDWIEHEWGTELPVEEKQFLSIHYVSLIQGAKGGEPS
jgi:hypothetical protein